MVIIPIIASVWIVAGFYAYGTTFAYFQGSYPTLAEEGKRKDRGIAILVGMTGIAGAIVSFLISGFNEYGWKL